MASNQTCGLVWSAQPIPSKGYTIAHIELFKLAQTVTYDMRYRDAAISLRDGILDVGESRNEIQRWKTKDRTKYNDVFKRLIACLDIIKSREGPFRRSAKLPPMLKDVPPCNSPEDPLQAPKQIECMPGLSTSQDSVRRRNNRILTYFLTKIMSSSRSHSLGFSRHGQISLIHPLRYTRAKEKLGLEHNRGL